jgi:hypothetical protein
LLDLLENPPVSAAISMVEQLGGTPTAIQIKTLYPSELASFTERQVNAALEAMVAGRTENQEVTIGSDDEETRFRRAEFVALQAEQREDQLYATPVSPSDYPSNIAAILERVTLVERLRETRAFTGFTRVFAEDDQGLEAHKTMLWREPPSAPRRWLPAYTVHGEGIYLELREDDLQAWERLPGVRERVSQLDLQYQLVQARRRQAPRPISGRFVLLHTLAHVLLNQMTFDCGYSSAALRERLYVSPDQFAPMAGLLIYTAAGDSEGTLGGLVRMGKPGNLEPVLLRAIEGARWCSADPVCMELGDMGGQGPDSCNLGACHNCALVPETSCEEFNRFLDRGLLVGTPEEPSIGYFDNIQD